MKICTRIAVTVCVAFASCSAAQAVCMEKTPTDAATLRTMVPAAKSAYFESIGFTPVQCSAMGDVTLGSIENMCSKFSRYSNEAANLFQSLYGVTPNAVCAAAREYEAEAAAAK